MHKKAPRMKHELIDLSVVEPIKQSIENLPQQFSNYVQQVCRFSMNNLYVCVCEN